MEETQDSMSFLTVSDEFFNVNNESFNGEL